jgi:cytochrome c
MSLVRFVLVGALQLAFATGALAEGDAAAGETVFKKCTACHNFDPAQKRVGPHLVGIIGRKAASVEGFAYSEVMKTKGTEGVVWDEATLGTYLKDPKAFAKGTKMAFAGIKDDTDLANLIAYLKSDPKPK